MRIQTTIFTLMNGFGKVFFNESKITAQSLVVKRTSLRYTAKFTVAKNTAFAFTLNILKHLTSHQFIIIITILVETNIIFFVIILNIFS